MLLPQRLDGLERYIQELPGKIQVEYDMTNMSFHIENKKLFANFNWFGGLNDCSFEFVNFMPDKINLILSVRYASNERKPYVWGICLKDKYDNDLAVEIDEANCGIPEFIAKPENLAGATDFLNKVLDKYNFHSIYDEFEKLRLEQKRKNQKSLARRTLYAIITGDF